LRYKVYNSKPQTEELKESRIFIGKFQIFCRTASKGKSDERNVYVAFSAPPVLCKL
jgi:hypothetical protein